MRDQMLPPLAFGLEGESNPSLTPFGEHGIVFVNCFVIRFGSAAVVEWP